MTSRRSRALFIVSGLSLMVVALTGCNKPLLAETDERSPFDRYDTVRNQYAEQHNRDEFGRQIPNLRARLMPKE